MIPSAYYLKWLFRDLKKMGVFGLILIPVIIYANYEYYDLAYLKFALFAIVAIFMLYYVTFKM